MAHSAPIDVLAREAERHGIDLHARSFLVGFSLGRAVDVPLGDEEALTRWCAGVFAAFAQQERIRDVRTGEDRRRLERLSARVAAGFTTYPSH